MNEPKHEDDKPDNKKIKRLQIVAKELRKDVNRALDGKYNTSDRLINLENENSELRKRVWKLEQKVNDIIANPTPKTSDHIKDESEKIEIELVKLDYFKPRMGNC